MTITEKENFILLKDEADQVSKYLVFLQEEGETYKDRNLAIDLSPITDLEIDQLLEFLPFSNHHREQGKSFVVITTAVTIEEVPEELVIVPTIGEAEDLIQMEEIERDLGF